MPWIDPPDPRNMTEEEFLVWEKANKPLVKPDRYGYMDDRLVDLLLDVRELLTIAQEAGAPLSKAGPIAHKVGLDPQKLGMRLRTAGFHLVPMLELRHVATGATLAEVEAAGRIRRNSQRVFLADDERFLADELARADHLRNRGW